MASTRSPRGSKEKLEQALWFIERLDKLRASAASRAAMVISADAILLAGITFLIDKGLSNNPIVDVTSILYLISAAISLILVVFSVVYAANTIVFVWRRTRNAVGVEDLPESSFFHPSDIVDRYKNYAKFEKVFLSSTMNDMVRGALGELMLITYSHHKRYKNLRASLRFLLVAIIPFLFCLALLILNFLR